MSQISKCPKDTVALTYWEASGDVSELRYKSLLYFSSKRSYCTQKKTFTFYWNIWYTTTLWRLHVWNKIKLLKEMAHVTIFLALTFPLHIMAILIEIIVIITFLLIIISSGITGHLHIHSKSGNCYPHVSLNCLPLIWLFSTVCFQMSPQIACIRRCIVTKVAFFTFVHCVFLMCSEVAC